MTPAELLAVFRDEVSDKVAPYLWSDSLFYTYLDDAQKQFCRLTFGIEDARSFALTLAPGSEWYALNPQIMEILGAYDQNTGQPIPVLTRAEAVARNVRFDGRQGPLQALFKGMEKASLRAYPVTATVQAIALETRRLPNSIYYGGELKTDHLEVDDQHHLNLLMWVRYRAYAKQDTETYDPVKSATHKQAFEAYCRESKIEQGRLNRNVAVVQFQAC